MNVDIIFLDMKIKEYDNSSYDLASDNEDGYKSSNDCFMILFERPSKI